MNSANVKCCESTSKFGLTAKYYCELIEVF